MKLDTIHYNLDRLASYNKPFNAIVSPRETGKTTRIFYLAYKKYKAGYTNIILRRNPVDITTIYINDIQNLYNKFELNVNLVYKKGDLKQGICDIYDEQVDADGNKNRRIMFRIIAVSQPIQRIKSLMLPNTALIIYDEFIVNTKYGEKYLQDETFKIKEIYNTFQRESPDGLKFYAMGNPYSLYNPLFSWWGVNIRQLKAGVLLTGENWAVECAEVSAELKAQILAKNPLYQFDDAYTRYAFNGEAINDAFINVVDRQPDYFKLKYVFKIHDKYLGIYLNTSNDIKLINYWGALMAEYNGKKNILCFDFAEMVDGAQLLNGQDKSIFYMLKQAIKTRFIAYKSIEESYLMQEIYNFI